MAANDDTTRAGWGAPDARQALLLRAALLDAAPARAAWAAWRDQLAGSPLPPGCHALLPLLYRNLERHGIDDPLLPRLRGVYRKAWVRTQLLHEAAAPALRALADAGIDTLLLGGTALVNAHYRDLGARPLAGFAVCVAAADRAPAHDVLRALGWLEAAATAPPPGLSGLAPPFLARHHLVTLMRDGHALHLAWHPCPLRRHRDADRLVWDGAVPHALAGVATRVPDPAAALVQACLEATLWQPATSLQWAADACILLRAPLDPARFVAHARELGLALSLRAPLAWLAAALDAPVPAAVLAALAALPADAAARREHALLGTPPHRAAWRDRLRRRQVHWRQSCTTPGLHAALRYLGTVWRAERPWRVPLAVIARARRNAPRPGPIAAGAGR